MKLKMVNAAIVIVGTVYNPVLFSHDSLRSAKLVKKSWELVQQPITTPAISILRYDNGLNLLVEPDRAQILVDKPSSDLSQTPLVFLADSVLRRLPSTRHTAVGFNITALIELENATEFLQNKFLKDDSLSIGVPDGLSLTRTYKRTDAGFTLAIATGTAKFEGDDHIYAGILITANYHVEFPANISLDAASRAAKQEIARATERYTDFLTLIPKIFELEEETNETA